MSPFPQSVADSSMFPAGFLSPPGIIQVAFTFTFTFTFSHLADAFFQSDLQLGST